MNAVVILCLAAAAGIASGLYSAYRGIRVNRYVKWLLEVAPELRGWLAALQALQPVTDSRHKARALRADTLRGIYLQQLIGAEEAEEVPAQ